MTTKKPIIAFDEAIHPEKRLDVQYTRYKELEKQLAEARERECNPENCNIETQAIKKENVELRAKLNAIREAYLAVPAELPNAAEISALLNVIQNKLVEKEALE